MERARLVDRIWRVMESRRAPQWYPFEIHLITKEELWLKETKLIKVL